jgi:hypothetical protein
MVPMARLLITAGCILIIAGLILRFAPWLLAWFGKLPGDIRFESGKSKVFIPITSMVIISIVLSILLNIFKR